MGKLKMILITLAIFSMMYDFVSRNGIISDLEIKSQYHPKRQLTEQSNMDKEDPKQSRSLKLPQKKAIPMTGNKATSK